MWPYVKKGGKKQKGINQEYLSLRDQSFPIGVWHLHDWRVGEVDTSGSLKFSLKKKIITIEVCVQIEFLHSPLMIKVLN